MACQKKSMPCHDVKTHAMPYHAKKIHAIHAMPKKIHAKKIHAMRIPDILLKFNCEIGFRSSCILK